MQPNSIQDILQAQRAYFQSGATLPVRFRKAMLKRLYTAIKTREAEITAALQADLGKPAYESFMCEVGLSLTEITHMLRRVKKYAREHRVPTPLAQFPSRSFTKASPFGNVLIMSPWNYPFLLAMDPLADAIAAGNTAIVKPSAYSPATSKIIEKSLKNALHLSMWRWSQAAEPKMPRCWNRNLTLCSLPAARRWAGKSFAIRQSI